MTWASSTAILTTGRVQDAPTAVGVVAGSPGLFGVRACMRPCVTKGASSSLKWRKDI